MNKVWQIYSFSVFFIYILYRETSYFYHYTEVVFLRGPLAHKILEMHETILKQSILIHITTLPVSIF